MKKRIELSVSAPCHEDFDSFTATMKGGYCQSCQKEVIDFQGMTDNEVRDYFIRHKEKSCGRFSEDQLKAYEVLDNRFNWRSLFGIRTSIVSMGLISLLTGKYVGANPVEEVSMVDEIQNPPLFNIEPKDSILTGVVNDCKTRETIPFAVVLWYRNGSVIQRTQTDFDGNFKMKGKVEEGDYLKITFLGFEDKTVQLHSNDKIVVELIQAEICLTENIVWMGEVQVNEVYSSRKSIWDRVTSVFR